MLAAAAGAIAEQERLGMRQRHFTTPHRKREQVGASGLLTVPVEKMGNEHLPAWRPPDPPPLFERLTLKRPFFRASGCDAWIGHAVNTIGAGHGRTRAGRGNAPERVFRCGLSVGDRDAT